MAIRTSAIRPATDLDVNAARFRRLRANGLSPKTEMTYLEGVANLAAFPTERGMPTAVEAITREHLEEWPIAIRPPTTSISTPGRSASSAKATVSARSMLALAGSTRFTRCESHDLSRPSGWRSTPRQALSELFGVLDVRPACPPRPSR